MENQTFDSIRWLASEVLLRRGALDRLLDDGLEAFMKDDPHADFTPDQAATVLAMMDNEEAVSALLVYWEAYDQGRKDGAVPGVRSPWLNGE